MRLSGDQIKSGFRIYTPVMLMSFIVITFRIIFIPNNLVTLHLPAHTAGVHPVAVERDNALQREHTALRHLLYMDFARHYGVLHAVGMVRLCAAVGTGAHLVDVPAQLHTDLHLIYDLLREDERRRLSHKIHNEKEVENAKKGSLLSVITVSHGKHINVTWFYDFVYMAFVPVLCVGSMLLSIWWAADVFDLTATVLNIFMFNFLNVPGVVQLSIVKLVMVTSQFFVFRYINYLARSLYHKYHKSKIVVNGRPNFTLANNVIAIITWGNVRHHLGEDAQDTIYRSVGHLGRSCHRCRFRHEGPCLRTSSTASRS